MSRLSTSLLLLALAPAALAHMSIWAPGMYGLDADGSWNSDAGDPVSPIGPDWSDIDLWWFRGPEWRAKPPANGAVELLPAGGKWDVEIACHYAWTKYGYATTPPGSLLDACPGNPGAYHSGDPGAEDIDRSMLSGCALGIADVDNINDVTQENFAIFSVKHDCVAQKQNSFEIPAAMPACTGEKCICGWMWLANNGTGNFYMTAFDCKVTGATSTAKIAAPVDPTWCDPAEYKAGTCKIPGGAKRPLYAYNSESNIVWKGNWDRPGYHGNWGFPNDGAQNDIFETAAPATTTSVKPTTTSTQAPASTTTSQAAVSTTPPVVSSSTSSSSSSSSVKTTTTTSTTTTTTSKAAYNSSSTGNVAAGATKATTTTQAPTTTTTQAPTTTTQAPVASRTNLARSARAQGSTSESDSPGKSAIDGVIDGYKEDNSGDESKEWVTRHQKAGAWLKLSWKNPVKFNQIVLYDRPNLVDQITGGTITFSDGTGILVPSLNNDGSATVLNLAQTKTVTQLVLTVTSVKRGTSMIGLSEIELFLADASKFTQKISNSKNIPRVKVTQYKARHARDFSAIGEDFGGDELIVDADVVRRSVGQDLVEEELFE